MSMRPSAGREDIEQFLTAVGRTRQPGRLYLTCGAALAHRGIRPGQTLDIDIQITLDPGTLMTQIAQLKQTMNINIEFWQCSAIRRGRDTTREFHTDMGDASLISKE